MPNIAEDQSNTCGEGSSGHGPSSITSAPTEYGQSYSFSRTRRAPRPRNPVTGWQTRNLSNIIPTEHETPSRPSLQRRPASQQPWSWLARQTASQIFPDSIPVVQGPAPIPEEKDANNNPVAPTIVGRRRTIWPWQNRAQQSDRIFNTLPTVSDTPTSGRRVNNYSMQQRTSRAESASKWPWQERALKSVIFELLTSSIEEKKTKGRTYQWDQRQSTSVNAAVHQQPSSADSSNTLEKSRKKTWPWQEKAKHSEVFRSPDKTKCPRQSKYVWDQRKTRFSMQYEPDAKFTVGSSYAENFVKWQGTQNSTKPAGKPCYIDEEVNSDLHGWSKNTLSEIANHAGEQKNLPTGIGKMKEKDVQSHEMMPSSPVVLALQDKNEETAPKDDVGLQTDEEKNYSTSLKDASKENTALNLSKISFGSQQEIIVKNKNENTAVKAI